jgi:hypothetical protein
MPPKSMIGVHSVRISVYRSHIRHGKLHAVKFLDIIAPWPLAESGGDIGYGPDLSDGFADSVEYAGTYEFIQHGVYQFNLPKGVTAKGVKDFGDSGIVTLKGIYFSSAKGNTGDADILGAGVADPPGVRWKLQKGYKDLGG